jgi:hypothetical protein
MGSKDDDFPQPMPPLTDNIQTALIAGGAFFLIGCATWFFSSRRQSFLRTFVPADELREASRSVPRDKTYRQGMRSIALLQMGIGMVVALVALGFWLLG